jgi:hypothetical protein
MSATATELQFQLPAAHAESSAGHGYAQHEFLKSPEAASLLRFEGPTAVKQFQKWADKHAVPRLHRGRRVLWERAVLVAFLHGKAWTRGRAIHGRKCAAHT